MDVYRLIKALCKLLQNKNYAINVNTVDKLITLTILKNRRIKSRGYKIKKQFQAYGRDSLVNQVNAYLC